MSLISSLWRNLALAGAFLLYAMTSSAIQPLAAHRLVTPPSLTFNIVLQYALHEGQDDPRRRRIVLGWEYDDRVVLNGPQAEAVIEQGYWSASGDFYEKPDPLALSPGTRIRILNGPVDPATGIRDSSVFIRIIPQQEIFEIDGSWHHLRLHSALMNIPGRLFIGEKGVEAFRIEDPSKVLHFLRHPRQQAEAFAILPGQAVYSVPASADRTPLLLRGHEARIVFGHLINGTLLPLAAGRGLLRSGRFYLVSAGQSLQDSDFIFDQNERTLHNLSQKQKLKVMPVEGSLRHPFWASIHAYDQTLKHYTESLLEDLEAPLIGKRKMPLPSCEKNLNK